MKRTIIRSQRGLPLNMILVAPLALLLLVVDLGLWAAARRGESAGLTNSDDELAGRIATALDRYASQLQLLARLPGVLSSLASEEQNPAGDPLGMEEAWRHLTEKDPAVSRTIRGPAAQLLRLLSESDPFLERVLLIDARGVLVAASSRTEHYFFAGEEWFAALQGLPPGKAVCRMENAGKCFIVVPAGTQARARGLLRADVDLPAMTAGENALLEGGGRLWAVGLANGRKYRLAGSEHLFNLWAVSLPHGVWPKGRRTFATMGIESAAVSLPTKTIAAPPARLVLVRKRGLLPFSSVVLLIGIGLSVLIVLAASRLSEKWIRRRLLDPLGEVARAGRWVIQTALGRPVELDTLPGLAGPSHISEGSLEEKLEEWLRELRSEAEQEVAARTTEMQHDLELAREFQMAYLDRPYPRIPAVHIEGRLRLEFHHCYHPALALGGDFFDIITLGPDCAGVFIADVMGHGTRSALITSILRTLMGDLAVQGRNARHFIGEMNKQFCRMIRTIPTPQFASAFYFVADTTARVATYTSAGHPSPFHVRRSIGRIARLPVPEPHGAAMGLIPDEKYTGGHCRLVDGDVFIFFTDGLYEAHDARGEEFGIKRMESVIRSVMYKDVHQIVDALYEAAINFIGDEPVADDICIVAVEVTTSPLTETRAKPVRHRN